MQEIDHPEEQQRLKRSVLLVSVFAAFLTPFLGSAINLALPAIARDFNASAIEIGWIPASFILSSAIFLLPFGRLAGITGRKKIFTYGIILFTLSTFLIIFSWNIKSFLFLRILQGISSAMIFGTSLAILTSVFEPGERGRAMMGIGFALFSSPNSNAIMSSVEKKHYGIASGVVGTMRMVGQMLSMGIAMMILALFIGQKAITPSTYPGFLTGMRTGFIIFSALCVLGIFASLARNGKPKNTRNQ